MRFHILLMLLVIVFSGDPLSKFYPVKPKLKEILLEVESQIKAGGSIDVTISYLDNIKATVDGEQIRHDQLYTNQKNQCQAELSLRQKEIQDAEQVSNRGKEQLENCKSSEQKSQIELETLLSNQKVYIQFFTEQSTDGDIKILEQIRMDGSQLFAKKNQNHIDGLRSIQEALKLLDGLLVIILIILGQLAEGTSLAQLSQISLKMISESFRLGSSPQMAGISGIFAQMLTNKTNYQEVYEQLKSLLNQLESTLYLNLQQYKDQEDTSISEYDERRVHIIEYYNGLKSTEQEIRDHISTMSLCQDQQAIILESTRGKKITNGQILDSAQRMCKDFQGEYEKASIVRKSEIDMIAEVKQVIIERTGAYKAKVVGF